MSISPLRPPSVDENGRSSSIHFFSLPIELRKQIYELVVVNSEHKPIEISHNLEREFEGAPDERLQPPLSHVCRQLYNEVLPIYYGKNSFVSPLDAIFQSAISSATYDHFRHGDEIVFLRWLNAIGDANVGCIINVKAIPPLLEDWPYIHTFDLIHKGYRGFTMAVDKGPASARHIGMKLDALSRPINERPKGKAALSVSEAEDLVRVLYRWVRKHYLWKFDDNNAGYQLTFWDIAC